MATDINAIERVLEAVDEDALERDVAKLRAQQAAITQQLTRRLDLLELKRRWRGEQGQDRPLGVEREVAERAGRGLTALGHATARAVATATEEEDDSPRGTEAVRRVMREGGTWTVQKLHDELARRGWVNPEAKHPVKATETALSRLHGKYQEVDRVGRGKYRYKGVPSPLDELLPQSEGSAEP